MKGTIVNRAGKFKHAFQQQISPNAKIEVQTLYTSVYAKRMTEKEFTDHLMKTVASVDGLELDNFEATPPKREAPVLSTPMETGDVQASTSMQLAETGELTPSKIASLKFSADTKNVLAQVNDTKTLNYALTMARKKNVKNKRLQQAIEKRITEIMKTQEG